MNNIPTDDFLLVSCPNMGGLVFVGAGNVTILSRQDTTGLCLLGTRLIRNENTYGSGHVFIHDAQGISTLAQKEELDDLHDVIFHAGEYILVSTNRNEIVALSDTGEITRQWKFPGEGDAWHLNCLDVWNNRIVASAFGEFIHHRGYKDNTLGKGFIFDLETGEKLWENLSQPHSPMIADGIRCVCNSELRQVLIKTGDNIQVLQFNAYTRGLALSNKYLYVGLSQSRNIPNSETQQSACIAVVDRHSLKQVGEIPVPFQEIYDIRIIPSLDTFGPIGLRLLYEERERYKLLYEGCNANLQITQHAEIALDRLVRHPIAGPAIRLLRWIKRDPSFGTYDH